MGDSLDGSVGGGVGETVIIGQLPIRYDASEPPLIFAWLVTEGEETVVRIASDTFAIGTGEGNQLVLSGEGVAADHCSIYWADNRFEIDDHNTRGGTRVNDQPVKRQYLADRDRLEIGCHHYSFHCFTDRSHE